MCKICGKDFSWSPSRGLSNNIQYCSIECRNKDPERRAHLLRINCIQQQVSPTSIERIGYTLLDDIGADYVPQYILNDKFCVDAFVPACKLVIQFDGDYWHGHPLRFPNPDERQRKRMRLDKSQDAYMRKCGFSVFRAWGSDLRKNPNDIKHQILAALAQ